MRAKLLELNPNGKALLGFYFNTSLITMYNTKPANMHTSKQLI